MAGCLIAYGAVLGKVSAVQLLVMTLFGVTLFAVEEYIILNLIHVSLKNNVFFVSYSCNILPLRLIFASLKARDAGGSMVIHTFGGYYGLSISWMLYRPGLDQSSRLQGSVYHSDVFAMIGGRDFNYIHIFIYFHNTFWRYCVDLLDLKGPPLLSV